MSADTQLRRHHDEVVARNRANRVRQMAEAAQQAAERNRRRQTQERPNGQANAA